MRRLLKLKRPVLSVGVLAFATCALGPGLLRSVAPAEMTSALADPLSLFEQRSPGARDDATTVDIKRRRSLANIAAVSLPDRVGSHGGAPGALPGLHDAIGNRAGPIALAGDGPGLPDLFGGGDAGDTGGGDVGAVSEPDGGLSGFPGFPYGGGSGGGGGGGRPPPTEPGVPAPEPATWAMLIAGFAVTGAAMRRRRRSAAKAGR